MLVAVNCKALCSKNSGSWCHSPLYDTLLLLVLFLLLVVPLILFLLLLVLLLIFLLLVLLLLVLLLLVLLLVLLLLVLFLVLPLLAHLLLVLMLLARLLFCIQSNSFSAPTIKGACRQAIKAPLTLTKYLSSNNNNCNK